MLRLPMAAVLATWALNELPTDWHIALEQACCEGDRLDPQSRPWDAQRLVDHRLDFLTYEGPLSQDRGVVRRCDRGQVRYNVVTDDLIGAVLMGSRITGELTLRRTATDTDRWQLTFDSAGDRGSQSGWR